MRASLRRSVFAVMVVVVLTAVAAGCGSGSETATGTVAGSPSDSLATLQVLSTDVTVQTAGANPTPGASGQGLNQGDEVSTDPNGFAEIGFTDGSLARVENNAQFVLTALTHQDAVTATHTQLLNGDSWHHVQPLADQGDLYQVDTPVASATVRGTQFAINCTAGTTCTYAVVEGTVQLALPDGTTLTLTAGQKITLIKDLPPPKIDTPGIPQLEQDPWIAQNLALDAPDNPPGTTPGAGPLNDGRYALTGTGDCHGGSAPIPSGSYMTVQGDQVEIVNLEGDPRDVTYTIDGDTFTINTTYTVDGQGGFTTDIPAGTSQFSIWTLQVRGTSTDGGETFTATGSDSGVNCGWTITGRLEGSGSTTNATTTGLSEPVDVARALYLEPVPPDYENACSGDYSTCPITPELKAAFLAFNGGNEGAGSADPICRCQNSVTPAYAVGLPLPAALAGQLGYAVVQVTLPFDPPVAYLVLAHQQNDGTWVAADIYCNAYAGDPDPYANRSTAGGRGCSA